MELTRRHFVALGATALAGAALVPSRAGGQTPKRGGTLTIRAWDPPHFDHMQTISYKTHIPLSFTHSRPEPRLRLRGTPPGRLARPLTPPAAPAGSARGPSGSGPL